MPLHITHFRAQHEQILEVVTQLETLVRQRNPLTEAEQTRHVLSMLSSHLRLHLEAEDQRLYPEMIQSSDLRARDTALRLQREMGGLFSAFSAYNDRWTTEAIRRSGPDFALATMEVLTALRRRIAVENDTLYPLAKDIAVSAGPGPSAARTGPPVIFVVDDNEADFLLITEAWREISAPAVFEYFGQAQQLLSRIQAAPVPDLLILDLDLPTMSGLELTPILRGHPAYARVPIVLCSSMHGSREFNLAAKIGATSFFPKPATFDEYLPFAHSMGDLISYHRGS